MADSKLTSLTGLSSVASGDKLYIVDVSDTSDSADGTSKNITRSNLISGLAASGANSDITSLSGLTTALSVAQGGTGATSAAAALTSLGAAPLASPTFTGTVTLPVGLTGVIRADTGVVSVDSDVTDLVTAADSTTAGKVELATTAETTTGTSATLAVTPDGLHDMTSLSGAAWMLDEDDMATDSATKVPSQQSVKAHVASGTVTMTNKRISPRVVTTTDDATAVIDVDVTDQYQLTAIANATEFTVTGTPVNGQKLIIRLKDAGVAKGLTWTGFTAIGCTAPTTTVANKTHYIGCIYNSATPTWNIVVAIAEA